MPYSIHEPAPRYPSSMAYGRGGAGNRTRPLPPSTLTSLAASSASASAHSPTQSTPSYSTGRGGAGNMHHTSSSDRRIFSFDEELAKQGKETAAPVYHIGRGGQGNAVKERTESDVSSSSDVGSRKGSEDSKRSSLEWVRGLMKH